MRSSKKSSACPRSLRILVVDDFRSLADYLASFLCGRGYTAHVAYDGAGALSVAEKFRPNALISDVQMPGMNGFELAQEFAARFPKCGVVLITFDASLAAAAGAVAAYGPRAYKMLPKPVAFDQLLEFLATCKVDD